MPTTYAIPDGRTVMAATLWTGNGTSQSISNAVNGVSMQPDFVWVKSRSNAVNNSLYDVNRGAGNVLFSNTTEAQATGVNDLTSFNSNGFSVAYASRDETNRSNYTYVGWQWKAGGAAVTNTAGSITSQVSANTAAGFSIVTYTGTGSAATIGHGLGVAPSMVIVKRRSGTSDWVIYNSGLTSAAYRIYLNYDLAQETGAAAINTWNATAPTSTVFSVGTNANSNSSGGTFVAYCWAAVPGYSALGSYTGNGSSDGPFVYTGFRPRFIMFKRTDAANNWLIEDSSRSTYNVVQDYLLADTSAAEANSSSQAVDFLSNGFKIRNSANATNASGGTYIYMAFAENPFKYANAR